MTAVGLKLNEVTGYKEVERLKELVGEKGQLPTAFPTSLGIRDPKLTVDRDAIAMAA